MEGEVQKVPVRLLLPHTVNIPLLRSGEGAFVITDEPALAHHYCLKSIVYSRVTCGAVYSISLQKCIVSSIVSCRVFSLP